MHRHHGTRRTLGNAAGANARNNAEALPERRRHWSEARDAAWSLLAEVVSSGDRIAVVGAGNGDDLPLERIVTRAAHVDLVDIDIAAALRAASALPVKLRERTGLVEQDVTEGGADRVLQAAGRGWGWPRRLKPPHTPIGSGGYDVVVGDLVYTQLLHPGLAALGLGPAAQSAAMRRFDRRMVDALVQRMAASCAPGGAVVHLHDVACWSDVHEQPTSLDEALARPDEVWRTLRRHDDCDPLLAAERAGHVVEHVSWWRWPFRPDKQFLVRGAVTRPGSDVG